MATELDTASFLAGVIEQRGQSLYTECEKSACNVCVLWI